VPDGLAWHVEQFRDGLDFFGTPENDGFLNGVGPNYDDSTTTRVPTADLLAYLKIGRNSPCHCDSGKKYKNCHAEEDLLKIEEQLLSLKN